MDDLKQMLDENCRKYPGGPMADLGAKVSQIYTTYILSKTGRLPRRVGLARSKEGTKLKWFET